MEKPDLSVVVASYNSLRTIRGCLDSLRRQDFAGSFEVIVVDSSTDGTAALVYREFPEVVLIPLSTRRFPGAARNIGIGEARGEIICFLDSDCIASPDWLSRIWWAHSRPDPVIGGCIDNAARDGVIRWGSYFAEFSQWMPGMPRGRLPNIPSCNLTFKRWILDELGPFGERDWGEDTAYNWRLRRSGYPHPFFEPAVAVAHDGITDLARFLVHELAIGRGYGQVRVAMESFGLFRRVAYALAVPLIHLVLCWRVTLRVILNGRHVREFLRSFPLVFLGLLAWSVGEGVGYVSRPTSSATKSERKLARSPVKKV